MRLTTAAAIGVFSSRLQVMAGPFASADWENYIPSDKKLRPEWVKSLFARGEPTVYAKSRGELKYIGMPVGGICCGTMYLSGDGRLWCWDIFNQNAEGILKPDVKWKEVGMWFDEPGGGEKAIGARNGANFVRPRTPPMVSDIAQGFAVRWQAGGQGGTRRLRAEDWEEVTFKGQYPVGTVKYKDPGCPIAVKLEAFSPFIPLSVEDSSLPATIFKITVANAGAEKASVDLSGWLQNAASFYSAKTHEGERLNRHRLSLAGEFIVMSYEPARRENSSKRPDILVDDFENGYGFWNIEGDAFGTAPVSRDKAPAYQGELGGEGKFVANSHASAPGKSVGEKDGATGMLTSKPFSVQRKYLAFFIGGGKDAGQVGMELLVDGKVAASATGRNENKMHKAHFDVSGIEGGMVVLRVYDRGKSGWGNIGVDQIVQTDRVEEERPFKELGDFGTMAIGMCGKAAWVDAGASNVTEALFHDGMRTARGGAEDRLLGSLGASFELGQGESKETSFVIAWHFPNNPLPVADAKSGNHYAKRFADAGAVAEHVMMEMGRLAGTTLLWRDTWVDSTLPHWLLERAFANTSILATTTCHRFGTGRFWAWEGIGCCPGTCTHVWHYAQAMGRIFPELERDLRERVDFGLAFNPATGGIGFRAEFDRRVAEDGQAGRILGVWREHQMSADDSFLRRLWPRVKQAAEYLLKHDEDGDGILDGEQENTLDAAWYGQIPWISSLAMAAYRAAEEMAKVMGDGSFAAKCRERVERGKASIESRLWNGEYFIQLPAAGKEKSLGTYKCCHIDQVFGQSWAWQAGLGRILDKDKTLSALRALWKYNFTPDVGPFREKFRSGRPYALAGDAGLIMTTNVESLPNAFGTEGWQAGYFNECMSGFEHQVASHMIAEGLLQEGLAVTRAIHDRYHAGHRNPWNEIECSDHYSRSMASYGTFISVCGFECDGPNGYLGFSPRMTPADFKCAFTSAAGWGSFSQSMRDGVLKVKCDVKWGRLKLKSLSLTLPEGARSGAIEAKSGGKVVPCELEVLGERATAKFAKPLLIPAGVSVEVVLS